jgi:2Fe-2S ferredoxin
MTVITFVQFDGSERMVDGDVGLSLMETALKHDIPGIDADCGGGAICGTCHCFVEVSGKPSSTSIVRSRMSDSNSFKLRGATT